MGEALEEIIDACRAQDREGWRRLYELFAPRVLRLTTRMVGPAEAADLVQDVFLRVFERIGQFAGHARFETWLYRLAVNECLQHLRQQHQRGGTPLHEEPASAGPQHTRQVEQQDLLEQALSRLDPDLRATFLLRELEGFSYRQIGETLGIPEGTVAWRLNQARERLRNHLRELGWDD